MSKRFSEAANVLQFLKEWDTGNTTFRRRILQDFVAANKNRTGTELEEQFADAASLFLARLTAYLRLTYMTGTSLHETLEALQIFLSAAGGHKFLHEFLEVGGIMTMLEILNLKQSTEANKLAAIRLLQCVSDAGRRYKELICECFGIRAIAECIAHSEAEMTQEYAKHLLISLAEGNPRFQAQVYKGLIALLPCKYPKVQQVGLQALRTVQKLVSTANQALIEPVLNTLASLHLEVQYEAIHYITDLMRFDDVRTPLLTGLVKLLRPTPESIARKQDALEIEAETSEVEKAENDEQPEGAAEKDHALVSIKESSSEQIGPLPVYVQQAAAAKCVSHLCKQSSDIAEQLIRLQVVSNLMFAIGNQQHAESQLQATLALEHLCRTVPIVDERVREAMGVELYIKFTEDPETLYTKLSPVQADVLVSNRAHIVLSSTQSHTTMAASQSSANARRTRR